MAEYQSVEINEETEGENISLEEQAAQQDAANTEAQQGDRPEWLDEKFESPEDLAKAYQELQTKQSRGETEEVEEELTEEEIDDVTNSSMSDAISSATDEWTETGNLSEDSFNTLAESGIPREIVESFIQGQAALVSNEADQVRNEVGGEEAYNSMLTWAEQNLSTDEQAAYNSMVESGNLAQAKVAAKGLYAQMVSAGGKPPTITQGGTKGPSVQPFGSTAQITKAMSDPRYANDPAYRQEVQNRISMSNVI